MDQRDQAYFNEIINLVQAERIRQNKKWGRQEHLPERWLSILVEEVGEIAKAGLDYNAAHLTLYDEHVKASKPLMEEWVQVAAVAFSALANIMNYNEATRAVKQELLDASVDVIIDHATENINASTSS